MHRLSFCMTCMGRLHHVKRTLPESIGMNREVPSVEFVLLDYSSSDGLAEWVRNDMQYFIRTGGLAFYRIEGITAFNLSHAKNLAHRLASGSIVCNLDADNFAGLRFAEFLIKCFSARENVIMHAPRGSRGASGRIALRKCDFERLGGYDERLNSGWGCEDQDLIERAKAQGLHRVSINNQLFLRTIDHSNEESACEHWLKDKEASYETHRVISEQNVRNGTLTANQGIRWGAGTVIRNFKEVINV